MSTSLTVRRSLTLAVTAALLLAGGCGVETSSEGAPLSVPTSAGGTTAPTGGDDSTTTVTPDKDVTAEDLEAILPEAGDVGAAYHEVSDDDDDDDEGPDPVQDAIDEECPDMVAYQDADDDDAVGRLYEDTQGRQINVSLKPSATVKSDADLADYIDAVNACDSVEVSDSGLDYELAFAAEEVPDVGEQAVRVSLTVTIETPDLPSPLTVNTYGVNFRLQDVGVQVSGTDGINGEQRVVFDQSRLDPVVTDVEARVKELVGG